MSAITTHVLDTQSGKPAAGINVTLAIKAEEAWLEVGRGTTNEDGRIADLLAEGSLRTGEYRLRFETGSYFRSAGVEAFFLEVLVTFDVSADADHFHVPLLLSPFAYSTYRGS